MNGNNQQNKNQESVIFSEDKLISPRIPVKRTEDESKDRAVNLIRKISGGRIQSKKVATYIVLAIVTAMFVISVIWFSQAL